jgi:hypothetical protein
MPRGFDIFAVVVALVTLGVVLASRRQALTPAWRGWQLGILCLAGGHGLHAAVRLLGASPDLVQASAFTRLVLVVPALWLMWRHRNVVSASPRSRV